MGSVNRGRQPAKFGAAEMTPTPLPSAAALPPSAERVHCYSVELHQYIMGVDAMVTRARYVDCPCNAQLVHAVLPGQHRRGTQRPQSVPRRIDEDFIKTLRDADDGVSCTHWKDAEISMAEYESRFQDQVRSLRQSDGLAEPRISLAYMALAERYGFDQRLLVPSSIAVSDATLGASAVEISRDGPNHSAAVPVRRNHRPRTQSEEDVEECAEKSRSRPQRMEPGWTPPLEPRRHSKDHSKIRAPEGEKPELDARPKTSGHDDRRNGSATSANGIVGGFADGSVIVGSGLDEEGLVERWCWGAEAIEEEPATRQWPAVRGAAGWGMSAGSIQQAAAGAKSIDIGAGFGRQRRHSARRFDDQQLLPPCVNGSFPKPATECTASASTAAECRPISRQLLHDIDEPEGFLA